VLAGRTKTIRLPVDTVRLVGYAVDDGAGAGVLETTWAKVIGPGQAIFADAHSLITEVSFSEPGAYVLELKADDSELPAADRASVNVLPAGGGDIALGGHWRFEGTAADISGNDNHGQLKGDPTYSRDTPDGIGSGQSVDLDGSEDCVVVKDHPSLGAKGAVTVTCWFKPRSKASGGGGRVLVSKGKGYGPRNFRSNYLLLQTNGYFLQTHGMQNMRAVTLNDKASILNQWHHVAAVFDAHKRQLRIYIDGVLDNAVYSQPATNAVNRLPLCIGKRTPEDPKAIDGKIDEVKVYTRALSDEEIAAMVPGAKPNRPPTVDAGKDITTTVSGPTRLTGSFADDDATPNAGVGQWTRWRKVSGPGQVRFDNRFSPDTSATFTKTGEYVLELQGSDGAHLVCDSVAVAVK
jgi:hypothetical protein